MILVICTVFSAFFFWYIRPDAKCVLLTTTTLYVVLAKDGRFQSAQNLQNSSKEVKDFRDCIVANIILWDMICVFQVCVSVFQRSLCDFTLHQQSLTNWWKEIWPSSLCFGVYLSSTEVLHVRLHVFVFCLEIMSSVVKITMCMLHKEV